MSTADGDDYAAALRAHMLGSATDEQHQLIEAVRIGAGYPCGRYPLPPTAPDGPVYTDPGDSGGSSPTGDDTIHTPHRSRYVVPLADQVAECGQRPVRSVRDPYK